MKKITIEREPLVAEKIVNGKYNNSNNYLCVVSQNIKEVYHYSNSSSVLSSSLYSKKELDKPVQGTKRVYNKKYTVFVEIPHGTTLEDVKDRLSSHPKGTIFRILSNHPILNNVQKELLLKGQLDYDELGLKQILRYTTEGKNKGKLILDRYGKPQYFESYLSLEGRENIDIRTSDPNDYYIPNSIKEDCNFTHSNSVSL